MIRFTETTLGIMVLHNARCIVVELMGGMVMDQSKKGAARRIDGSVVVDLGQLSLPADARARVGAQITKAVLNEVAQIDNLGDLVIAGRLRGELWGFIRPEFDVLQGKELSNIVARAIDGK